MITWVSMHGYGVYVWLSYGAAAIMLFSLTFYNMLFKKRMQKRLKRFFLRKEAYEPKA